MNKEELIKKLEDDGIKEEILKAIEKLTGKILFWKKIWMKLMKIILFPLDMDKQ